MYHTSLTNMKHVLHVVERMEEGIDELSGLYEESGQFVLHGGIDVVVLVRCDLKVLLELQSPRSITHKASKVGRCERGRRRYIDLLRTLNKFFSSFSDFSFLSRSLVRELL